MQQILVQNDMFYGLKGQTIGKVLETTVNIIIFNHNPIFLIIERLIAAGAENQDINLVTNAH